MIIYIFLIVVDEVLLIENCSFFSFLFMFTLNKHLKPVVYEVCVCVCVRVMCYLFLHFHTL